MLNGRITISLSANEVYALRQLAEIDHRQPREQARFIIWRELKKRGLLVESEEQTTKQGVKAC